MILSTLFSFPAAGSPTSPPAITALEDNVTVTASALQTNVKPQAQVTLPDSIVELNEAHLEKMVDTHQALPGDTVQYTRASPPVL